MNPLLSPASCPRPFVWLLHAFGVLAALLAVNSVAVNALQAQQVVPWPKAVWAPSPRTQGLAPVQSLNKTWWVNGKPVQAPFGIFVSNFKSDDKGPFPANTTIPSDSLIEVKSDFHLGKMPKDTFYLYWESLGGLAEIWLNGKLLNITREHGEEVLLPIDPSAAKQTLRVGRNLLSLKFKSPVPFFKKRGLIGFGYWMGPINGGWILQKQTAESFTLPWPKAVTRDTLYIASYFLSGVNLPGAPSRFSDSLFKSYLKIFKVNGLKCISFSYRPPNQILSMIGEEGMGIQSFADTTAKRFVNLVPSTTELPAYRDVWWNERGEKAEGYGKAYEFWKPGRSSTVEPAQEASSIRNLALALGALPLLLLVFWRLYDAESFRLLVSIRYQTAKSFELIAQNFFVRQSILLLVSSLRVLLLAAVLAFWYHIHARVYPDAFWPFDWHEQSVAARFTQSTAGGWLLGVQLLLLLVVGNLAKYLLVWLLAQVYRRRLFVERLLALEAYAHLPWLVLLFLLGLGMLVVPAQAVPGLYWALAGIALVYVLRKYYLLTQGLARALKLVPLANILYICAVEFLPWFWVLW